MKHAFGAAFIQKTFSVALAVAALGATTTPLTEAYAPEGTTETAILSADPLSERLAELTKRVEDVIVARNDILWLARIVYSETKRPDEQVYIAWVVRNRVDLKHRGTTYEEVALAPRQFSGLHSSDRNYNLNISRTYESTEPEWRSALAIAKQIYYADESERPFSGTVTHFYTPQVVVAPEWARNNAPVLTIGSRFAFHDIGISG